MLYIGMMGTDVIHVQNVTNLARMMIAMPSK